MTQAPSQSTSTGHAREQLPPSMLASRMRNAEPRRLPVAMRLMNPGTSMCVGQAVVHGASKQYRQRFASTSAACGWSGGFSSRKRVRSCGSSGRVAMLMKASEIVHATLTRLRRNDWPVQIRAAISIELPCSTHFGNLIHIQISRKHFVFVTRGLRDNLAARIGEVTRSVELADVPGRLCSHAINGCDEISVGGGVRRLFQLPQVLAQSRYRRRRIEHNLRTVEAQATGTLGKVAVIADIDADLCESQIEDGISQIPGPEIELLPKAGSNVRYVSLSILTHIC